MPPQYVIWTEVALWGFSFEMLLTVLVRNNFKQLSIMKLKNNIKPEGHEFGELKEESKLVVVEVEIRS